MTQEEKAKAYDEALSRAKASYGTGAYDDATTEFIFPGLSESEDERIRKRVVEIFEAIVMGGYSSQYDTKDVKVNDILAWLEKQKEQPTNEEMLRTLRAEYEKGVADTIAKYEQKEQNIVEIVDPKFNVGDTIVDKNGNKCTITNRCLLYQYYSDSDHSHEIKFSEQDKWELVKQKPTELPKSEDYGIDGLYAAIDILQKTLGEVDGYQTDDGILEHKCAISAVKELYEQKPTEWKQEYREEDLQTRFAFYTYKDDPSVLYLSNVFVEESSRNHGFGTRILKSVEKVAETIGVNSVRLKVAENSPAYDWYCKYGYRYLVHEDGYDWLEKNLEYMKPHPKVEWSEEDEKVISDSCCWLAEYADYLMDKNYGEASRLMGLTDKLKSLRPYWKPSEEQMGALRDVIEDLPDYYKPKIIDEINRLLDLNKEYKEKTFFLSYNRGMYIGRIQILEGLLNFINNLEAPEGMYKER